MGDQDHSNRAEKTDATGWLPAWVLDEKKQKALAFLGALGAAIGTATTGALAVWHWYEGQAKPSLELKEVSGSGAYRVSEDNPNYMLYVWMTYSLSGKGLSNCTGTLRRKIDQTSEAAAPGEEANVTRYKPSIDLAADRVISDVRFRFYLSTAYSSKDEQFRLECDGNFKSDWMHLRQYDIDLRPDLRELNRMLGH